MIYRSVFALVACAVSLSGYAQSAPPAHIPPATNPAANEPMPEDQVRVIAQKASMGLVRGDREGMNAELQAKADASRSKVVQVGDVFPVNESGSAVLPMSYPDGVVWTHLGTVTSIDALGLRVQVDLSKLQPGEQLWVIDPTVNRAYGPYTSADHVAGGRWLQTVMGDTAVLMAQTSSPAKPNITVVAVSHLFVDLDAALAKLLSCNVNVACETNPELLDAATAVGVLLIQLGFGTGLCTGSLINNAITPELEPFLITANHCIADTTEALGTEVRYDYRADECGSNNTPVFGNLPGSVVTELIATNDDLDATLVRLNNIPSGIFGRTLLGWDTRAPVVDEDVIGIHHPGGSHMRLNHGRVTRVGIRSLGYVNQTEVVWDTGVTEGGSSGSPLLFETGALLFGMLSNGLAHTCGADRSNNIDSYASFRHFYPAIAAYIDSTDPPGPVDRGGCPAKSAFKDMPALLDKLRAFRDKGLLNSILGREVTDAYYDAAPTLADSVETSDEAKHLFKAIAAPFASLGEKLQK